MSARDRLAEIAPQLRDEEILVLEKIAARLLAGQSAYGILDLRGDKRNFCKEMAEEALDLANYAAMMLVQEELRKSDKP